MGSIKVKEGETVNVGSLLGTINSAQENVNEKEIKNYNPPIKEEKKGMRLFDDEKKVSNKIEKESVLQLNSEKEDEPLILSEIHEENENDKKVTKKKTETKVSPSARKIAKEANIDLNKIHGTGKNGIVLKEDLMSLMGSKPAPSERKAKFGPEERVKMTRLRMTIAKRLKEAQDNAAMLTTFNEVDMSEVIAMRNLYKEDFQKDFGVKLGFMSFFVKACVIGLKNYPAINAEIQNDEIVYKNYYNISIAVGTDKV